MKINFIICCLLFFASYLNAQVVFEDIYPEQGTTISFTYTPQAYFQKAQQIEAYAYLVGNELDKPTLLALPLTKEGKQWKGKISPQTDTKSLLLVFVEMDTYQVDNNKGKGYFQVFYDQKKPLPKAYMGLIKISEANYILDIKKSQIGEWAKQEFKYFPENKARYFPVYAEHILKKDKKKIEKELKILEKKTNLDEEEMSAIYDGYQDKDPHKQVWENKILAQYPTGKLAANLAVMNIYQEKDASKRSELMKDFVQKYPKSSKKEYFDAILYWENIKEAIKNQDKKQIENLLSQAPEAIKDELASNANNKAWDMTEKNENLAIAELLSRFASTEAQNRYKSADKQDNNSAEIPIFRKFSLGYTAGMHQDTYGWVLYKQGKYLESLNIYTELLSNKSNQSNGEYLERYFLVQDAAEKTILENLVKANKADSSYKARLRRMYIKEKQSEQGFEEYIAAMEAEGKRKARENLLSKMTNDKSPDFEIKDWKGNAISPKTLRGKIVVLDFWATWCGPCLASFPGMRKAVEQYKNDKEVIFIFVATWDEADNVKQWIEKNKEKYPFYIVYDEGRKMADTFGIRGVPTKFVLDKKGFIRFSSIGSSNIDEVIRSEMEAIIETIKSIK